MLRQCCALTGLAASWSRTNVGARDRLSTLGDTQDRLRPPECALLISPLAFFLSMSVSKPNTAEYFRPTTCATRNARLIPASEIAFALACPSPGLLSPVTISAGMPDSARPADCAAATALLVPIG